MNDIHKAVLREKKDFLIHEVTATHILQKLLLAKVIDRDQTAKVLDAYEVNKNKGMAELLQHVSNGNSKSFDKFLDVLRKEDYNDVADELVKSVTRKEKLQHSKQPLTPKSHRKPIANNVNSQSGNTTYRSDEKPRNAPNDQDTRSGKTGAKDKTFITKSEARYRQPQAQTTTDKPSHGSQHSVRRSNNDTTVNSTRQPDATNKCKATHSNDTKSPSKSPTKTQDSKSNPKATGNTKTSLNSNSASNSNSSSTKTSKASNVSNATSNNNTSAFVRNSQTFHATNNNKTDATSTTNARSSRGTGNTNSQNTTSSKSNNAASTAKPFHSTSPSRKPNAATNSKLSSSTSPSKTSNAATNSKISNSTSPSKTSNATTNSKHTTTHSGLMVSSTKLPTTTKQSNGNSSDTKTSEAKSSKSESTRYGNETSATKGAANSKPSLTANSKPSLTPSSKPLNSKSAGTGNSKQMKPEAQQQPQQQKAATGRTPKPAGVQPKAKPSKRFIN